MTEADPKLCSATDERATGTWRCAMPVAHIATLHYFILNHPRPTNN